MYSVKAWNLNWSAYTFGSIINSWTTVWPPSMLTTEDMDGRSAGDGLVHRRATLIILIASSLLKSDPSLGSTSPINFPFCCETRACNKRRDEMKNTCIQDTEFWFMLANEWKNRISVS